MDSRSPARAINKQTGAIVHAVPHEGPPSQHVSVRPSFLTRLLGGAIFGACVASGVGTAGYVVAAKVTGESISSEQVQHDIKSHQDFAMADVVGVLRQTPVVQNIIPHEEQP